MNRPMVNFSDLQFLVIDDQAASRQTLRSCAQTVGAFSVTFAENYGDAIYRIRNNPPDVLLCDYLLGNGRSGQQLLEELRRFDLLPDDSVFIMVTAEQAYEQVVSAVELVPDDYILKPFSPDLLLTRLERAMAKKIFFAAFYRARRERDFARAKSILASLETARDGKTYAVDVMRAQAELLIQMENGAEAQIVYGRILEMYSFPWANAGKARALMQQQLLDEARKVVDALVEEAPMFLAAHDLKARICTEMGDHAEAQATLKRVSEKSPRNFVRKRAYAIASLANGDASEARTTMEDVIANDSVAGAISIDDHLALVRIALEQNDIPAAEKALRVAAGFDLLDVSSHLSFTALRSIVTPDQGRADFHALRHACLTASLSLEVFVDVIRAALAGDDTELADLVAKRLMKEQGVRGVFQQTFAVYQHYGREPAFREIQKQVALERIQGALPLTAAAATASAGNLAGT